MVVIGTLVEIWTEKAIPLKAQTKTRNKVLEAKCRGPLCYLAAKTLWDTEWRTRLSGADSSARQQSAHLSCHEQCEHSHSLKLQLLLQCGEACGPVTAHTKVSCVI